MLPFLKKLKLHINWFQKQYIWLNQSNFFGLWERPQKKKTTKKKQTKKPKKKQVNQLAKQNNII